MKKKFASAAATVVMTAGLGLAGLGVSVAMKKYPLVAKWRYPVLAG